MGMDLTTAQVIGLALCVIGMMAASWCMGFEAGREHTARVVLVELERINEEKEREEEEGHGDI